VNIAAMQMMFLLISAPFIGSFLGVVMARLPEGKPIATGRSACPQCGHVLTARDLVPLVSWMMSRGRCRYCLARIDLLCPAAEIAALLIAVWCILALPGSLVWIGCGLGWTLLTLAVIDQRHFLLPDRLTLPLAVGGLLFAWLIGTGGLLAQLTGALLGFLGLQLVSTSYRLLRGREGLGAGDGKLFGALGAWVGWQGLPTALLYAAASGLLWSLARARSGEPLRLQTRLPFGPHLCIAGWLVWLYGPLDLR
jgi:leader peptidase (prepilin peptidase)/N-methyltransferase